MMKEVISSPFFAALAGWLLWNWIGFNLLKNEYDDKDQGFSFRQYMKKHWEYWFGSLLAVPVLLYFGYLGGVIDFTPIGYGQVTWNDTFYVLPGPFYGLLLTIAKKLRGSGIS